MKSSSIFTVSLLAAIALGAAGCAGTKTSASKATPATASADTGKPTQVASNDPNDPIICKGVADSTSRVQKHDKVCLKKSEWDEMGKTQSDTFNDMRNTQINRPGGN